MKKPKRTKFRQSNKCKTMQNLLNACIATAFKHINEVIVRARYNQFFFVSRRFLNLTSIKNFCMNQNFPKSIKISYRKSLFLFLIHK